MKNVLKILVFVAVLAALVFLLLPDQWRGGLLGPPGTPGLSATPMKGYSLGRVHFSVPETFAPRTVSLLLNGRVSFADDRLWSSPDKADDEFQGLVQDAREAAEAQTAMYVRMGGRAIKMADKDVSELFGMPARLFCYPGSMSLVTVQTLVQRPEGLLEIFEARPCSDKEDYCSVGEEMALVLADMYRFGQDDAPDGSFRTSRGRLEGLGNVPQAVRAVFAQDIGEGGAGVPMTLVFSSYMLEQEAGSPQLESVEELKELGVDAMVVRDQEHGAPSGLTGRELGLIVPARGGDMLTLRWVYPGVVNNPAAPCVAITLEASAKDKDAALLIWDAVIADLAQLP